MCCQEMPTTDKAEGLIIGAILADCEANSCLFEHFGEADFMSVRHKIIFSVASALYAEHGTVDEVMAATEIARRGESKNLESLDYLDMLVGRWIWFDGRRTSVGQ